MMKILQAIRQTIVAFRSAKGRSFAEQKTTFASRRRGVAVLLVLGMLAMTLALSYASLRSQATVSQLASNVGRGEAARLAAESGIFTALRRMSEGTWAGVSVPFSQNLSDNNWYDVSFSTGDGPLPAADPSYNPGEFAYRVTITSIGYASDPGQPSVRAIHKIDAIVQLARRSLLAEPAGWNALEPLAVHQWSNRLIVTQFPVRFSGPVQLLGTLNLFPEYPLSTNPEQRYFRDLDKMRVDGLGDHRPYNGPINVAKNRQTQQTLDNLQDLGVSVIDSAASTTPPAEHPGTVLSYKLYPGGKSYTIPILQTLYGSSLQNRTIAPNPVTNPLGIYRSRNSLAIYNNVNITGTIISDGTTPEIQVHGTDVSISGVNLAPLESTSQTYQLPVALVRDDLRFHGSSDATVRGLTMVYDEFELKEGPKTARFNLTGQLMTSGLAVRGRSEIALLGSLEWETQHALFLLQLPILGPTEKYYPVWMQTKSAVPYSPLLRVERETNGVKYHWHNWTQPVYQKDPADAGLRWNLIRWTEAT
jgi:hypothetical protein